MRQTDRQASKQTETGTETEREREKELFAFDNNLIHPLIISI